MNSAEILGMTLILTLSCGCQEDAWKTDSCHIIRAESHSETYSQASEPKRTLRWLEALNPERCSDTQNASDAAESVPDFSEQKSNQTARKTKSAQTKTQTMTENCVDINHADEKQLITLPGVGAGRAQKIIQAREKRPFKRKTDITRVKGIGRKSYRKMAEFICDIK